MLATPTRTVLIILLSGLLSRVTWGDVRLPALVGDNMVLQRDAKIHLWGWAAPGEVVRIAFRGAKATAKSDQQGRWEMFVGPFKAGGPYEMTVSGRNRLSIHNILLGDVWVASGQSNMEFPLKHDDVHDFGGVPNAAKEIAGANYPAIRLFKLHHKIAVEPQTDVEADTWFAATPDSVGSFSAVAFLFGREMYQRYQVPIGLIESNWGGTVAEAWMSAGALKQFPEFDQAIASLKQSDSGDATPLQTDPSPMTLFNGMVAPLTPYTIKGVIWYQGESNIARPSQYRALFPALIKDWRSHWGYEFPFLFVQLAGFQPNGPDPADYRWAELREAQSMALSVPHTGMATAADVGDALDVHPKDKQDVAHRLALVAAKTVYGENIVDSGPTYQSMEIEGDAIRIKFSSLGSGLMIKDQYGYLRGFEIAAADGKFIWAQARQEGDSILVYAENVRRPVAVRYDWMNTPDGNVYNKEGLPALPFRTDGPVQ